MANKKKTVYVCSECGAETANWAGKCPSCGMWNTLKELDLGEKPARRGAPVLKKEPQKLSALGTEAETASSPASRSLTGCWAAARCWAL